MWGLPMTQIGQFGATASSFPVPLVAGHHCPSLPSPPQALLLQTLSSSPRVSLWPSTPSARPTSECAAGAAVQLLLRSAACTGCSTRSGLVEVGCWRYALGHLMRSGL